MQLIGNGTQISPMMPAKRALSGTPGYANNAPGSGTATIVDADILNTWLAEIVNVILAAGIALDPTNNAQLLAAIRSLVSSGGVTPEWTAGPVSSVSGGTVSGGVLTVTGLSPSSLALNGWKKYPDPNSPTGYFIEQWGVGSVAGNASTTVTMPIAFPNSFLNFVCSLEAALAAGFTFSLGGGAPSSLSQVPVTCVTSNPPGPFGFYWMAKGY